MAQPRGILRKPGDEPREPKGDLKVEQAEGHEANSGNRRAGLARKDTGGPVKKKPTGAITRGAKTNSSNITEQASTSSPRAEATASVKELTDKEKKLLKEKEKKDEKEKAKQAKKDSKK